MFTVLAAFLAAAQPLPPPFPREGATLVLDNEQVAIWDVSWERGKPTKLHEHRFTALSVTVRPGRVKSTLPDGTERVGALETIGNVQYGGKGLVHREEGVSETPRRVFLMELKEATPPPDPLPEGVAPAWPRAGATKILDNELVVVWDYTFSEAMDVPLHFHDKDQIVVTLGAGRFRVVPSNGEPLEREVQPGRAAFVPRGELHREEFVSGSPRIIVIQLK